MSILAVNYNTELFKDWPAVVRPEGDIVDISEWVREHSQGEVIASALFIHFKIAEEATFFNLAY